MNSELAKNLTQAIFDQNQSFLKTRDANLYLQNTILKIPERKLENEKHKYKSKLLLKIAREIDSELAEEQIPKGEQNYYGLPPIDGLIDYIAPPKILEGYLYEALRQYFSHDLKIRLPSELFDFADQYFDFRLDHMLEEKDLLESMEIQHMRDWALIGKALAILELERRAPRKGRPRKNDRSSPVRNIDQKRLDFIDGVYTCYVTLMFEEGIEPSETPTDIEIITIYRQLVADDKSTSELLEKHIKLLNITDNAFRNSISRARTFQD